MVLAAQSKPSMAACCAFSQLLGSVIEGVKRGAGPNQAIALF